MAEETISDAIEETAKGPARVSVDGTDVTAQDIEKQIKADMYLAAKTAQNKNHAGIGFRTLEPGGCG